MKKYVLTAAVYEKPGNRGIWCVEAIDMMGSVEVFVTVFAGPNAQLRAMEYARAKYERVETDFASNPRTPALARPPRHADADPWESGGLGLIIDADRLEPAPRRLPPGENAANAGQPNAGMPGGR